MRAVLAIDAAWTEKQPSGIALLKGTAFGWECIALAPSYDSFAGLTSGVPVNWNSRSKGSKPDPARLLSIAQKLLGATPISLVAVDIPVATTPVISLRAADRNISREYGARGCSTHAPTAKRPGHISTLIAQGFCKHGFPLATARPKLGLEKRLLEVYPHPALLSLLNVNYRFQYKITKTKRFWPNCSLPRRLEKVTAQLRWILTSLRKHIKNIPLLTISGESLAALKPYEDAADALVCAWVGVKYLNKEATPYGDENAAIWVPGKTHLAEAGTKKKGS